ncbi:MAG: pyridoxine 5'-phosphate synthase [Bacteroidetes bacterium]|nr:pyridoxine 5'-phosphate synthase [Bacteroidota bacterium]MCL5738108.1 pyridoxine 5'-phosphate synthase [Bacteroidota bacterium]
MKRLSVNIDHVATLRQARGENEPDPVTAAHLAELAGAIGIVSHLREDRRHIQDNDVYLLRRTLKTKLDLEMAATEEIIKIALDVVPDLVTLVPEKRQELTTEGGLDVASQVSYLKEVTKRFHDKNILVSLFVNPNENQIKSANKAGADFVELHTGEYANAKGKDIEKELARLKKAAKFAHKLNLKVNAGHGLNYRNLKPVAQIEEIEEFSIGHALISHALYVGMERAVKEMIQILSESAA